MKVEGFPFGFQKLKLSGGFNNRTALPKSICHSSTTPSSIAWQYSKGEPIYSNIS